MGIKKAKELLKKTPAEIVVRDFDFANDDVATGEAIATIASLVITRLDGQAVVPGTDLTKDSQSFSGMRAQFIFSKGVLNVKYHVQVTVTTSAGQTLVGCGEMVIKDC